MKKFLIIGFFATLSIGCTTAQPVANVQNSNNQAIVSSHIAETRDASQNESSPMAHPVDISRMTADIERAEKEYKKNPKVKEALAKAYFARAFELTNAAQYRSALGDFRKGLKLNPDDEDARMMHDKILEIFKSINRDPPKEGEEPPPLPFKKGDEATKK